MYFYTMCIDAAAVHAGQLACQAGFPAMGGFPSGFSPACDETPLYVVPLIEGLLCPFLVRWRRRRRLAPSSGHT